MQKNATRLNYVKKYEAASACVTETAPFCDLDQAAGHKVDRVRWQPGLPAVPTVTWSDVQREPREATVNSIGPVAGVAITGTVAVVISVPIMTRRITPITFVAMMPTVANVFDGVCTL